MYCVFRTTRNGRCSVCRTLNIGHRIARQKGRGVCCGVAVSGAGAQRWQCVRSGSKETSKAGEEGVCVCVCVWCV
jgi:hypothetical protein